MSDPCVVLAMPLLQEVAVPGRHVGKATVHLFLLVSLGFAVLLTWARIVLGGGGAGQHVQDPMIAMAQHFVQPGRVQPFLQPPVWQSLQPAMGQQSVESAQWRGRRAMPPRWQGIRAIAKDASSASARQQEDEAGFQNQLLTQLMHAVNAEDYETASIVRKKLDNLNISVPKMWADLLDLEHFWLADRTEQLGFSWPTQCQELGVQGILQRREDTAIISETGSGKTLAYLVPLLAQVDPKQSPAPQVVVVVPSRALGIQVVMLTYRLMGGSFGNRKPGSKDNMFRYRGPRGLNTFGVFDDETAVKVSLYGKIDGCHIVVGTPRQLRLASTAIEKNKLRAIVVDEADAMLADPEDAAALDSLLTDFDIGKTAEKKEEDKKYYEIEFGSSLDAAFAKKANERTRPIIVMVGATLVKNTMDDCLSRGWLQEPVFFANPSGGPAVMPSHVEHRVVSTPQSRCLLTLVRLIRSDILERGNVTNPGRTILFLPTNELAREVAPKLRNSLWGEHTVNILNPESGDAQYYLEQFRDKKSSLLIATNSTERGIDLPDIAHVYILGMPPSRASYVHRSGRAGRIGNMEDSDVTTVVNPEDLDPMRNLLEDLGVSWTVRPEPDDVQVARAGNETTVGNQTNMEPEKARLEDVFNLLNYEGEDGNR